MLWWLSPGERRDAVGISCNKGATMIMKAVSSIDDCVCVI